MTLNVVANAPRKFGISRADQVIPSLPLCGLFCPPGGCESRPILRNVGITDSLFTNLFLRRFREFQFIHFTLNFNGLRVTVSRSSACGQYPH